MPAKAGIQSTRYKIFWIPAFEGMTVCIAENSLAAQFIKVFVTGTKTAVRQAQGPEQSRRAEKKQKESFKV